MSMNPQPPPRCHVELGGLLGQALSANVSGHLAQFVRDERSPAITLFCPDHVRCNHEGDWYGEHAGKWLYTAARAATRTSDPELTGRVQRVADYLVGVQESDGYLGTYAPARRFMHRVAPGPQTWDRAPGRRTWDIWVHACMLLGLLEVHRYWPKPGYLQAAQKIGDLCWRTLTKGRIDITSLGNHHGLSATVLMDPAVELYLATGEKRYLALAELVLQQASQHPPLELLGQALAGTDAAAIGTGKAYQLGWNLVGLVKLHRATGNPGYLEAALKVWENIRQHHLTLGGGPWGGVALRSREVFNSQIVFSPYGYVETCSTLSWIQLNRELLHLTDDARYADEIEKSAYNDLLGAQAPNGVDWCYYIFPNGKRIYTTYWRCCKSSGPLALEELPPVAYTLTRDGSISVNIYGPSQATLPTSQAGPVRLEQVTDYPFDGHIRIIVRPERPARLPIRVRIPSWAEQVDIRVNDRPVPVAAQSNTYAVIDRDWQSGDVVTISLAMPPKLHRQVNRNIQESRAPDGSPVCQEVLHFDYAAITRGPLVYATDLIDGFKMEETIRLPRDASTALELLATSTDSLAPAVRLNLDYRAALTFRPYFEAGGRADGAWRLTWLQVTPS